MRTGQLYQRYYGVYLATVVDIEDPESLGRVRVEADQFDDSQGAPVWVSVARPAAAETSVFFTPKVGDQVILAYLVGDVNEPVILGYAHSKRKPKPEQVSTTQHGVVTTIGSVIFDEDAKKITVTFSAGSESTITMDEEGITIKAPNIAIEGDTVCVNGDAVVLRQFIDQVYVNHTHPSGMGPTGVPVPLEVPAIHTECD